MNSKYEKVASFYALGVWNDKQVKDAVGKGWITEDEYREITGRDYEP